MRYSLLLVALFVGACARRPPPPPVEPAPADEATLPPPFTAEQIHAAMPAGTRMTVKTVDASGVERVEEWQVVGSTAEQATFAYVPLVDGALIGDQSRTSTVSWTELEGHARFPADATTVEPWSFETPLGPMEGWRYVQLGQVNGQVSRNVFEFSRTHPGPPLRMTVEVGGVVVARMEVLGVQRPDQAP